MSLATWRARNRRQGELCWATRDKQYRALLASMLRPLMPFEHLLEVGCHSGPNLWAIRQQLPEVQLAGIDPSADCLAVAKQGLEEAGCEGVVLIEGFAPDDLLTLPKVDVVLTCYTLAYLQGTDLDRTLTAMTAIAEKAIVIAEPMPGPQPEGRITDAVYADTIPTYRHDYAAWFLAQGWQTKRKPFPLIQHLNGVVIATHG